MNRNFTHKRTSYGGSKPSFGPRRNFHPSTGSGYNRSRRPSRSFARIDESKFINKASENNYAIDYAPKHKFSDFHIDERLKHNVLKKGYIKPTAIQDKSIPEILKGHDLLGSADTGTGKTAAFLLPFIDKIIKNRREKVLILAPTRELALQINAEFMDFSKGLNIYSVVAVGGAGIGSQIMQMRRGFNILIGTPGRVKDLTNRKYLRLNEFSNAVLDEADRMLDMGFIADMKFLLGQLPKERQTLFFSATLPKEITNLTEDFLKNPVRVETKIRDTSSNVEQDVIRVGMAEDKMEILHELLIKKEFKKVLIFGKTKMGVERLYRQLHDRGFKAVSIHGDKSQSDRQRALKLFKDDRAQILAATDVAARGLDIPEVTHVINFDIPNTYEDYIHRIGRTGRAHHKGVALTFVGKEHAAPAKNSGRNFGTRSFSSTRRFGRY